MSIVSICLLGPESTGKTTLARSLADQYGTFFVPEFGRLYCEIFGNECDVEDLRAIVRGHKLLVSSARRKLADGLLLLDTDTVMTSIWSDILLGFRPDDLDHVADVADLYFLTDVDVPFAKDDIRYFPDQTQRNRFFQLCREELERRGLAYIVLTGSHQARLDRATRAIDELRNKPDKP